MISKAIKLFPINLHPLNIITKIIRRNKRIHINTIVPITSGCVELWAALIWWHFVLLYLLCWGFGDEMAWGKGKKAVASVKRDMTMGKMCTRMLCIWDIDVNVYSESYNTLLIHSFLSFCSFAFGVDNSWKKGTEYNKKMRKTEPFESVMCTQAFGEKGKKDDLMFWVWRWWWVVCGTGKHYKCG